MTDRLAWRLALCTLLALAACAPRNSELADPEQADPELADPGQDSARPSGDAGEDPTPEFLPRSPVTPTFRFHRCPFDIPDGEDIDCGTLRVAEDRDDPDTTSIHLAVAMLRATGDDPRPDPLVYLEGGPGGSALSGWWTWLSSPLRHDRDLILLDQRGTGYSRPRLFCDEDFDDASYRDDDTEVYERCGERLEDDFDLANYETGESAADVAELRLALEIEEMNLLGISYGTRLAMVAQTLYPTGIRSVILDSSYPPGVEGLEEQAPNAYRAIEAVFDACRSDPPCDRAFPDLENRFTEAMEELSRRPVDGIDAAYLIDSLFVALYDSPTLPHIPRAMELAIEGDVDESDFVLLDIYAEIDVASDVDTSDGPDDSDALFFNMECLEEYPHNELDDIDTDLERHVPEAYQEGLFYGVEADLDVCDIWPVDAADLDRPLPRVRSSVPTLVMAGAFDPITPPRWGRQAARRIDGAYFLEFPDAGHAAIDSSGCATKIAEAFLDDPDSDPELPCFQRLGPPDWVLD